MFIASNIKHLRVLLNLGQRALASAASISNASVSQYETGQRKPRASETHKIAQVFGVTVEMLMNEDLAERWPTRKEYDEWRRQKSMFTEAEEARLRAVGLAPILLDSVIQHYIIEIARLRGGSATPLQVLEELEEIYQDKLAQARGEK